MKIIYVFSSPHHYNLLLGFEVPVIIIIISDGGVGFFAIFGIPRVVEENKNSFSSYNESCSSY